MSRKSREALERLQSQLIELRGDASETANGISKIDEITFKKIDGEFTRIHRNLIETGQNVKSIFHQIGDAVRNQSVQWIAKYLSLQDMIRYARQMFTTIEQLDTALIDLKKTTTMSNTDLEEFYQNSSNIAKQTGVTTQEIISQAAAWSRLKILGLLYGNI